ncbi:SirB2 family protein [Methylomonas sp. MED-D]|uniref:SirB2 family protein n=1 Tax=unclassified Methylomonas TaxID=2608980 RepID=UPI0028A44974|nr:SirB2 family protein [Methylomonas sp. MV1]MDT4332310.1 SirB2 family protein [Methylomonas sp. MV1]
MVKHIHLFFVALLVVSFLGRVALAQFKPELLARKWLKLAPHVIAGVLLLSGAILVFQGDWLAGNFGWIVAKLVVLVGFMIAGVRTIREEGASRWRWFGVALLCLFYISKVAMTKQIFFFFG